MDQTAIGEKKNSKGEKKKVCMVPISSGMLRITKRCGGKSKDLR